MFGQVCKEHLFFQGVSSTDLFFFFLKCQTWKLIVALMHKFSLSLSLLKSNNDYPLSFQLNDNFKESGVLAKHTLYCHPKQRLRASL